jgi:lysine biosynthesis protein LysW
MIECVECRTRIELPDTEYKTIIACPGCGIELEILDDTIFGLQLGPSEE